MLNFLVFCSWPPPPLLDSWICPCPVTFCVRVEACAYHHSNNTAFKLYPWNWQEHMQGRKCMVYSQSCPNTRQTTRCKWVVIIKGSLVGLCVCVCMCVCVYIFLSFDITYRTQIVVVPKEAWVRCEIDLTLFLQISFVLLVWYGLGLG